MSFECASKGTLWITRKFDTLQDWSGYDTLHWGLYATTSGKKSHFQVQVFDADNNEVQLRRHLYAQHLGKWTDMSWNFASAKPKKSPVDFSRVKMLIFSAWQDYYGHQKGDNIDYWISKVTRERGLSGAMIGAARATAPPVLDGKLTDPCWQRTSAAQQFYQRIGEGLAQETSHVRLLWDDDALYIGMTCFAAVLDPVYQRLSDFAARATEHDGPVWRDDSVEVFLAGPDTPEAYLQFALNALGTQYEGKQMDGKWDAPWQVQCATDTGRWTAELAIPWATLGLDPAAGEALWANFCRTNVAVGEHTSWSPVTSSFHDRDEFGRVMLLDNAPSAAVFGGVFPPMMLGENALSLQMTGVAGGEVLVRSLVRQGKEQVATRQLVGLAGGEAKTVRVPVAIDSPGEVTVALSVLDAKDDAVLLQSPAHTFTTAAVAPVSIAADGPCRVYLNGKTLAGDSGAFDGYLEKGVNVIGLQAGGDVSVSVQAGALSLSGTQGWKQAAQAPEGWLSAEYDDGQWASAAEEGGRLDTSSGLYFRRTVLAETTSLRGLAAPGDLHAVAGGAQHLPFVLASGIQRDLRQGKFVLELPSGLEWVDWGDKKPYEYIGRYAGHNQESVSRQGQAWTRHEFSFDVLHPLEYREGGHKTYANEKLHTLALVIRETAGTQRDSAVRFWVEGEEGSVMELPRVLPIEIVPPLGAKRPRSVELLLCHGFSAGGYSGPEIAALADTWRDAGFNAYIERTYAHEVYSPLLHERGFRVIAEWPRNSKTGALRRKENAFVDFDEKTGGSSWLQFCPSWMTTEGREEFTDALAAYIGQTSPPPEGFWWDMEFGPKALCFCPRCLERFAQEYKTEGKLTRERLMGEYLEQWTQFGCRMWTEVSATYSEGLKKAVPDARMYTYSGYQTPRNRKLYCIDWTVMRDGCDVASAGYGWNETIMGDTLAALEGQPLIGGVCYYEAPRDKNLALSYLKLLLAGCGGVMHFTWCPLDGLDYGRISRAAALVADHEEFFLKGGRADELVTGAPVGAAQVLRLDDRLLVVVLNPDGKEKAFDVSIPKGAGAAVEYFTGASYADPASISLSVPPHDVRALSLRVKGN